MYVRWCNRDEGSCGCRHQDCAYVEYSKNAEAGYLLSQRGRTVCMDYRKGPPVRIKTFRELSPAALENAVQSWLDEHHDVELKHVKQSVDLDHVILTIIYSELQPRAL